MLTRWERAYQAFETPEEELRKFVRRLRSVGAEEWDRNLRIIELCSGRGGGLRAWHALGFRSVLGVDLSFALVSSYDGPGQCVIGNACALPLASASFDVVIVQGGLHHLASADVVERALAEAVRVARPDGRIVVIEPWLTPFLVVVHLACRITVIRRLVPKIDALAIMTEEERPTYERWLNAPDECLAGLRRYVDPQILRRRWGKLVLVGTPRR